MLGNLASYLGYPVTSSEELPSMDVRLRAVEEDDDWILVERQEQKEEEESECAGMTRVTLAISTYSPTLSGSSRGAVDIPCNIQESWYLTPPPSFTSEGPVHMETSPLENLLIEHPSMSVYQHSQTRKISSSTPPTSDDEQNVQKTKKEKLNKLPRNKINTKFCKKINKRPQTSSSEEMSHSDEEKVNEPKNKVQKSPRRFGVHDNKTGQANSSSSEMISIPSAEECVMSEPEVVKPPRRLYSEVLGTKSKPVPVVEHKEEEKVVETPVVIVEELPCLTEETVDASVPEDPASSERGDDRRRVAQTATHQQRLHSLNRSAQKTEQRKTCDQMKRNNMGRHNKVREINSRNKKQRRADMMQRHSGANNNRKSC